MEKNKNKFDHINDSGLRWALKRIDRELEFEKTMAFKVCAILFIVAVSGVLSSFIIGRNQLGLGVGFVSILLLGVVSIVRFTYVDVIPFIRRVYDFYRKEHSSEKAE